MLRECDLSEISDGRKYGLQDMVKVGCEDCKGCSACCQNMVSILLDPYDCYQMMNGLHKTFDELLGNELELQLEEGLILPGLKMQESDGKCVFLDENGRCRIHSFRPGICRLFPLGRLYAEDSFSYILQVNECKKANKTKVKVSKWIDTPDLKRNQRFVLDWHLYLKQIRLELQEMQDADSRKNYCMYLLNEFYRKPYLEGVDFYESFNKRMNK